MDKFLKEEDDLGKLIQDGAWDLYQRLQKLDVDQLKLPSHCLDYYKASHSKRLFFSIETSAHLLYEAIKLTKKPVAEIILLDYGAGVGTLYLLAKKIGCKKVIYNDHLEDWKLSAKLIADSINIKIDEYIIGDIDECLSRLENLQLQCDLITSRNVIEHIYRLDSFYNAVHQKQSQAIIYSSTTANKNNPASVLKHIIWHRKWEKIYRGKRIVLIQRQSPGMSANKIRALGTATKGLATDELEKAIDIFRKTGIKPNPSVHRSNTCDPGNGVWAEHLLTQNEYRQLINEKWFTVIFKPGFWDTHYQNKFINRAARILNYLIAKNTRFSLSIAPFIYVIAIPALRK